MVGLGVPFVTYMVKLASVLLVKGAWEGVLVYPAFAAGAFAMTALGQAVIQTDNLMRGLTVKSKHVAKKKKERLPPRSFSTLRDFVLKPMPTSAVLPDM